ncbi:MAG: R3H domain-containing nucleic acid-binding protein [Candidatus Sulfopaludibacter sp.]|nr:R3H domain-containing nucleic acid-binding protein [Candidatus Sulfopaludibacter sp.]
MTQRKYSVSLVGLKIDGFLGTTLQDGGFRLSYDIQDVESSDGDFETPDVMVKFTGPDVDLLLANRAELLLALEHVTMEMLKMPSEDHSRISFDANDYRLLRIEELRLSAMAAADKVKRTGVPFRFNPMNSRERRVIHLALRGEATLRSESSGSGPQRQVVVYPAGMASLPELPYVPEPRRHSGGGGDRGPRRDGPRREGGRSRGPRR